MNIGVKFRDVWRKNAPELVGLFDGSLPDFVTARKPDPIGGGIPIFCYHLVDARNFRADLTFLKENGYRTLSGAEFLAHLQGAPLAHQQSVLLTFDDGPRNFYEVAFPLLQEYSAKAVHFIAPALHADADVDADIPERPMDWRQLREIHATGLVEFQSHTLESRYVPHWPKPAALAGCNPALENSRRLDTALALREDFARSRALLEENLPGAVANQLSFPMYHGTEEAIHIARDIGIEACYWGYMPKRPINNPGDSPFAISRISDEFLRRLPGRNRISFREIIQERLRRIRVGREWRRRFPDPPANYERQ